MADINEAIRIELFNNRAFMDNLADDVVGLTYRDALVVAMDAIESRIHDEFNGTRFKGNTLRTVCWWDIGEINYGTLAREALAMLGVA